LIVDLALQPRLFDLGRQVSADLVPLDAKKSLPMVRLISLKRVAQISCIQTETSGGRLRKPMSVPSDNLYRKSAALLTAATVALWPLPVPLFRFLIGFHSRGNPRAAEWRRADGS